MRAERTEVTGVQGECNCPVYNAAVTYLCQNCHITLVRPFSVVWPSHLGSTESAYTTSSDWWSVVTLALSCTVSEIRREATDLLVENRQFSRLTPSIGMILSNFWRSLTGPETSVFNGAKFRAPSLHLYNRIAECDGQMDTAKTGICIASYAYALQKCKKTIFSRCLAASVESQMLLKMHDTNGTNSLICPVMVRIVRGTRSPSSIH